MQKTNSIISFFLIQLILTTFVGTTITYGLEFNKAPEGLKIANIDLSGLNKFQALEEVEKRLPKTVAFKGEKYTLNIDTSRDNVKKLLDKYYLSSRGFNYKNFSYIFNQSVAQNILQLPLSKEEIIPQLEDLGEKINREPLPAKIYYENGTLIKENGINGLELNIKETWTKFINNNTEQPIQLVINEKKPYPSTEDVESIQDILGDYTTYFNSEDKARTTNIRIGAQQINNVLIPPGSIFSFNEIVGERTESSGYLPAFIFSGNKIIKDDGGGICQDTSTLYQAVLQAHLPIIERHKHTLDVSYVPKNQDATVLYNKLDFKFKNDSQGFLLISTQTGRNWLRIRIFGREDENHVRLKKPDGFPVQPKDWLVEPK